MEIFPFKMGENVYYTVLFNNLPLDKSDIKELVNILTEKSQEAQILLYPAKFLPRVEKALVVSIKNPTNEINQEMHNVVNDWIEKKLIPALPKGWLIKLTIPIVFYHKKKNMFFFFLSVIDTTKTVTVDGFYGKKENGTETLLVGSN